MRLITTETQRHREIEDGKDPERALSSVLPPSRCTATWVPDSLSRRMKSVCATNSICRGIRLQTPSATAPCSIRVLKLDCGYKIDLIVQDEVLLELKAVERVLPIHEAQLLTYLKLTGKRVGLLINFNVPLLTQGIIRRVL